LASLSVSIWKRYAASIYMNMKDGSAFLKLILSVSSKMFLYISSKIMAACMKKIV
jgi:hypothetical protein